jgi:hypothetical protein
MATTTVLKWCPLFYYKVYRDVGNDNSGTNPADILTVGTYASNVYQSTITLTLGDKFKFRAYNEKGNSIDSPFHNSQWSLNYQHLVNPPLTSLLMNSRLVYHGLLLVMVLCQEVRLQDINCICFIHR